ncbi:MAG: DUF995 domain-containing protein [Salinarimonadaceae bacterium]|nr:MAG: DUF995 domain-containing protein [Salinarimonadaceae bacterium]
MSNFGSRILRSMLIASAAVAMMTSALAAGNTPPADARQLTAVELLRIFGDRTWVWENGGAFFQSRNRTFRAHSKDDGSRTYAEGRWRLTNSGRLCLQAEWRNASGRYPDVTCFSHVRSGTTIYQRRGRSGNWYVLVDKGRLPKTIVSGDVLSKEYAATRKAVSASRR